MGTFGLITVYSILVLVGLSIVSAMFVFLGIWIADQSDEEHAH